MDPEAADEAEEGLDRQCCRDEGHAEAGGIDRQQAGALENRVLGPGHGKDGSEDRADAGGPAEGEGEAHDIGAPEADGLFHLDALLAIEDGEAEHPEEVQAHGDDGQSRRPREHLDILPDDLAERRGCGAQRDEDGGKARDEEEACQRHVAAGAAFVVVGDLLDGRAGDEGQVGRHQRQHAGAQEGQEPRSRGGG